MKKKLDHFIKKYAKKQEGLRGMGDLDLVEAVEKDYQAWFLSSVISEIENILAIDHRLPVREILELAAQRIVKELSAVAATIRVLDPDSPRMVSSGAAGISGHDMESAVDVQDSISGRVTQEKRVISVASIANDPLYKNKDLATERGFHSLLAVPLILPTPTSSGNSILGTIQIYYTDDNRQFDALEIVHAELLARRISFVLAKKKIFDLEELNLRKETIVNKIFVKLSRKENIKLKDLFVLLIPELQELLNIQSCALFTVSDDQQYINLETAYPLDDCYFDVGHTFTVAHHAYFEAVISGKEEYGDWPFERITQSYLLIKNPSRSSLISSDMNTFIAERHIHSILLIPLYVDGQVSHLLAFYATDQKEIFSDDEIQLLIFFGKEIIKATRLEFMSDVLHDIKNPAIAVAGFANRARRLLQSDDVEAVRDKLTAYLDIIASESSRMQDLALAMAGEGREEVVNLAEVAEQRWQIVEEVIQDPALRHVKVIKPDCQENMLVFCPRFGLERIVDNLLGNAARAVPGEGGSIGLRCYQEEGKVFLSVENTGEIAPEQLEAMQKGAVKGRGLSIIDRFVHANHGGIKIEVGNGTTRFIISFPLAST